jgi:hypothetical protein
MHIAALYDLTLLIHQAQVLWLHECKGLGMRVNPEMVRQDGIADCDVAACPLVVVTIGSQPAESGGVVELAPGAFVFERGEAGNSNFGEGFGLDAGFGVAAVGELGEGDVLLLSDAGVFAAGAFI